MYYMYQVELHVPVKHLAEEQPRKGRGSCCEAKAFSLTLMIRFGVGRLFVTGSCGTNEWGKPPVEKNKNKNKNKKNYYCSGRCVMWAWVAFWLKFHDDFQILYQRRGRDLICRVEMRMRSQFSKALPVSHDDLRLLHRDDVMVGVLLPQIYA
ncbi:uncharacterized protein LOC116199288 [Punica granatum]|uniref:Uncharacterized protein LOC116199288 n=1 Tax=Punica granatum TaxID=22663 RepID=A0A6P8CTG8_PUNGR|nr:uncharacterized protein LOC116199288 [Punica granatum]